MSDKWIEIARLEGLKRDRATLRNTIASILAELDEMDCGSLIRIAMLCETALDITVMKEDFLDIPRFLTVAEAKEAAFQWRRKIECYANGHRMYVWPGGRTQLVNEKEK